MSLLVFDEEVERRGFEANKEIALFGQMAFVVAPARDMRGLTPIGKPDNVRDFLERESVVGATLHFSKLLLWAFRCHRTEDDFQRIAGYVFDRALVLSVLPPFALQAVPTVHLAIVAVPPSAFGLRIKSGGLVAGVACCAAGTPAGDDPLLENITTQKEEANG